MAEHVDSIWRNEKVAKLLADILKGDILELKPQLDFQSKLGFSFPAVNQILGTTDDESVAILESLTEQDILVKKFFDKFLQCPQCKSMNLRPLYGCPECGSGNIIHGRVMEHLVCKYAGIEDEFLFRGGLVCPKCKQGLHTLGTDYRRMGLLYKCRGCEQIFNQPVIKWRCLKCSSMTDSSKIIELDASSYTLNEEKRNWLQFKLKPKSRLIEFMRNRGYEVKENASVEGKSGAKHTFDLMATRDDGIVVYNIAIGIEIADKPIELDRVFSFDNKAYDTGLYDKVLIAIPGVTPEARQFAARQRIKVLELTDLEAFSAGDVSPAPLVETGKKVGGEAFQFKSGSELVSYLQGRGYEVTEDARFTGESETEHTVDFLATRDDGLIVHNIAIDVEVSDERVGIDKVFDFDDKVYDAGIPNKILIASPGLSREAVRFAQRQRITVFEVHSFKSQ